jgi:hypothetical protein
MASFYDVEVVVKEVRTYRVYADSLEGAEDEALARVEMGTQAESVELFDGNPYIHDSREVSE